METQLRQRTIRKQPNGKYRLISKSGKNLGEFDTKEGAQAREKEVQAFKHMKKTDRNDDALPMPDDSGPIDFDGIFDGLGYLQTKGGRPDEPVEIPDEQIFDHAIIPMSIQSTFRTDKRRKKKYREDPIGDPDRAQETVRRLSTTESGDEGNGESSTPGADATLERFSSASGDDSGGGDDEGSRRHDGGEFEGLRRAAQSVRPSPSEGPGDLIPEFDDKRLPTPYGKTNGFGDVEAPAFRLF